ncbi:MAG: DNA-processing protein DprA, partial [Desulfobaccales bacterium]|nr:DNA-processing protein DprA [Desulfobaccales bacterium]
GLALGVVVVEAGVKSGTSITVRYALDQGREVMAVPGPIDSPTSVGPHNLIQQGAKLVREVEDILEEMPGATLGPHRATEAPTRPVVDDPLLLFIGSDPIQLEELVKASRLPPAEVLSRLTLLELQGLVRELPGKCYVLEN